MEIPDIQLAHKVLDVLDDKKVVVFIPSNVASASAREKSVYESLLPAGLHRNVFLINRDGKVLWRVADYDPVPGNDCIVQVSLTSDADCILGTTYDGKIFRISIKDGSLRKVGWGK